MKENGSESGEVTILPDRIDWRVHVARERPLQAFALVLTIVVLTWLFWNGYGLFYGLFCLAVLVVSMLPFFLPISYEMDQEGVTIVSLFVVRHFRPWSDFRSYYHDEVGVQLSPFGKPSRLAVYRGNFMRFSMENREEVLAFLDEHIRKKRIAEAANSAR